MSRRATLIAAAAIETVILTAAPAHADPESDYINAVQQSNVFPVSTPDQRQAVLNHGYLACSLIRAGNSVAATSEAMREKTGALDNWVLIGIARQYLCPDTL